MTLLTERHLSRPRHLRMTGWLAAAVVAAGLAAPSAPTLSEEPAILRSVASTTAYSIWPGTARPVVPADPDTSSVTLGVRFRTAVAGEVRAIRFFKSSANSGPFVGQLWNSSGRQLAKVRFNNVTRSGWQSASLATPVKLAAGRTYTASYTAPHGRYAGDHNALSPGKPKVTRHLTATQGVYNYGAGAPTQSWMDSNYYVDVRFAPASTSAPTPAPAPDGMPTPGGAFTLRDVDGGAGYYRRWTSNTLPSARTYFPVGVWMETGPNASSLKAYGINMIVNPVAGVSRDPAVKNVNALDDEVDMWAGPGNAAWTGNFPGQGAICRPSTSSCGYTIMQAHQAGVRPGELRYANYGKGVAFWQTDFQAAQFVNKYQDVTSADLYWGTDDDLCQASQGGQLIGSGAALSPATCHKPSNYGITVDRVRSLLGGSKPVWNYIELGHPGSNGGQMPVSKIRPAVWSSLIHGARGIVYFNHSFGGSCRTQHVLHDCNPAIARAVTAINAEIASLATVLNSPSIRGVTTTAGLDASARWNGTNVHVFAMPDRTTGTTGSITVPGLGSGTARVIGENRTVPVTRGRLTDGFASANTVHLYRITTR